MTLSSAAAETANVLRESILENPADKDEWFLGSEDDLVSSLGVSRPTLRQGLRLLEQEQLVAVRRGVGGGIFARRPSIEGVAHTASVFLRSEGTTYGDLIRTLSVLCAQCAHMVAENPDPAVRQRLLDFVERRAAEPAERVSARDFVRKSGEFEILLATLSGSATMRLFVSVLIDLALPTAAHIMANPEDRKTGMKNHLAVARAIADGNAPLASRRLRVHLEHLLDLADEAASLLRLFPRGTTSGVDPVRSA
ncbi:MAG TPA: FCD domain-containing protein [Ilumatobacteraceae bacterium]